MDSTCAACGTSVEHLRWGARYCGRSCKQWAYRSRKRTAGDPAVRHGVALAVRRAVGGGNAHKCRPGAKPLRFCVHLDNKGNEVFLWVPDGLAKADPASGGRRPPWREDEGSYCPLPGSHFQQGSLSLPSLKISARSYTEAKRPRSGRARGFRSFRVLDPRSRPWQGAPKGRRQGGKEPVLWRR